MVLRLELASLVNGPGHDLGPEIGFGSWSLKVDLDLVLDTET